MEEPTPPVSDRLDVVDGDTPAPGPPSAGESVPIAVAKYQVSPRNVATGASIIAISSLAALSVVAAIEKADELATIALVLAILAFVVQILVFVVQNQAANEQRVRGEQLHTQTSALLTEVRATAQSTQALIGQQFNQLLQAFVRGAAQTAQETKFDPDVWERRLLENVRTAVQPQASGASTAASPTPTTASPEISAATLRRLRADRARRAQQDAERAAGRGIPVGPAQRRASDERLAKLKTWPAEDDAPRAVAILRELSPIERGRLQRLGNDEITSREGGTYVGLIPESRDEALEARDLVTKARVRSEDAPIEVARLTNNGVDAARLLTALGDIPTWAEDVIEVDSPEPDDDIPF
jgi:hypothetical protein